MKRPGSVRVFSFHGVDLFIHVSLLVLLAYIVVVAAFQFPAILGRSGVDPRRLWGGPWIWGVIFALGLFVSVAAHEFGHALVAQAMGVRVRGITLMMLGGVSEMEHIPEQPLREFWLAIVGPLVSLLIAVGLGFAEGRAGSANIAFFCFWVGSVNLVLAVFNLIPAFPLDGGRALRSVLAVKMGFIRATRVAARSSQFLAWALGILGVLTLNFLLVLIAFFVYVSARSELAFTLAGGELTGITVAEIAVRVPTLERGATLREAISKMMASRVPVLPVSPPEGDGEGSEIVTLRRLQGIPRAQWNEMRVAQLAQRPSELLDGDRSLASVARELALAPARALPVGRAGVIIGVIRYADLAELLDLKERFSGQGGGNPPASDSGDHRQAA